jgi:hypothetical protein
LVNKVSSIGSTAYIVTTPPPSATDFPSKYSKLWGGIGDEELEQLFNARATCQNRVKRKVASNTEAVLIDLEGEICPNRACLRYLGDDLVRPDGMHFEGSGAAWASNWILSQVDATLPVPVAKLRPNNPNAPRPQKCGPAHRDQGS